MERIGGRYLVRSALGRGGMGTVHAAIDEETGREVAIKHLHPELCRDPALVRRFRREASVLGSIRHPSVVEVLDSGGDGERLFLVMERIVGRTLRARLDEGALAPEELEPILRAVAAGLAEAHGKGVVHGDLKPENVFLAGEGSSSVKIVDFGSCKVHGLERLTETGETIGTPAYMAPELFTGRRAAIDHRIDLYSLGVVAFEALAGALPFRARHPGRLLFEIARGERTRLDADHGVHVAIAEVVHRAISPAAEDRFREAVDLADAFGAAVVAAQERGPS